MWPAYLEVGLALVHKAVGVTVPVHNPHWPLWPVPGLLTPTLPVPCSAQQALAPIQASASSHSAARVTGPGLDS